ncbi:hypothetical protein E2605_09665 [Dysgonomonas capnocytophagoides]|uniref:Uncharacterized protein n=2 Tax=Dysgonomonas capnocytophagoides TaxID=45254 RepID=A0A4Y8L158_9BACT|nr:hypothetical protein [Dysgonomonas capnocytophagoides]TFD96425.1 hypothetical protein E2605_09665 [Dysgonomonas capnocytophagoides]
MLMNDLLKTSLFSLLSESSQKDTTNEMRQAYETFVEKVETLNQPETDYSKVFRSLNLTRIELVSLSKQIRYEQGEKCV